jgi:hypothetical protein
MVDENGHDKESVKTAHGPLQTVNPGFDSGEAVSNRCSVFEALFEAQYFFVYLFRSHLVFGFARLAVPARRTTKNPARAP